jgi:hypothetical protein
LNSRTFSMNDDRLVGEGLEQGDLPLGEEASLGAAETDRAERDTFSHQGNAEDRAVALPPRQLAALGELVRLGLQVSDLDSPSVQHRSTRGRPPNQRDGEPPDSPEGDRAVMSDEQEVVAVPAKNGPRRTSCTGELRSPRPRRARAGCPSVNY